jgi:hypothetical protein
VNGLRSVLSHPQTRRRLNIPGLTLKKQHTALGWERRCGNEEAGASPQSISPTAPADGFLVQTSASRRAPAAAGETMVWFAYVFVAAAASVEADNR